ncbi:non-homologous end-joining DNA ligase [Paenibacillus radicis (ex Gao et al. 2016)]|uniref:DNA polymerase domain-containing protein n=1 Tax=Paenibacillus radicis (ex Gao et al. 2016) TaxID=1737354 RepID=A0A917H0D4_9BACL|nr:non-homologous end-joining DNA ligase [Paenibacillus radicis (ex Gao et al. 2016)]GGG63411.1 DNA polymerase domain-containing protein [Paenibacillus radicis (ex Gao et al. 2016)]
MNEPRTTSSQWKKAKPALLQIEGEQITVTNPDKPLWPEDGITKLQYMEKLAFLSPFLIKHCRNRYLTTIRFPHGIGDKSFYQKNCPVPKPDFVQVAESNGISYVRLDSLPTLLWLGNLACLEFHASFDLIGDTEYAPEWVLDLDPTLKEEPRIMEAAGIVGKLLQSLGIQSVPKTSGATGLQIIVPLAEPRPFEELRQLGQFIGDFLSRAHPALFTVERLTKNRGDLIYVDYLQHFAGKTIAAPYTPRARIGAPVSTPLTWDEVHSGRYRPRDFNLLNITERLQSYGDLMDSVPPQKLDSVLQFVASHQ